MRVPDPATEDGVGSKIDDIDALTCPIQDVGLESLSLLKTRHWLGAPHWKEWEKRLSNTNEAAPLCKLPGDQEGTKPPTQAVISVSPT